MRIRILTVGFLILVFGGNLFAAVPDKLVAPRSPGNLKIDGDPADCQI